MACFHLITIKNPKTGEHVMVPCGHCIGCLQDLQNDWSLRMTNELNSDLTRPAVFVTLTYNDENLPTEEYRTEIDEETGEIFKYKYEKPCVVKSHIQTLMKELRTKISRLQKRGLWKGYNGKLKYFFNSEYGPENGRPHYHGIIYGLSKKDADLITDTWNKGFCYFGEANAKTIRYVSKYCIKPVECTPYPNRKGYFDNERWMDEQLIRRKPFRLMSTKLGANYFESPKNLKFHFKKYHMFKRNYIPCGKFKYRMPRYYKNNIYNSKNEKDYGYTNFGDYIITAISNYQYKHHITALQQKYANNELDIAADMENAKQKERLLIKSRQQFLKRKTRYHRC